MLTSVSFGEPAQLRPVLRDPAHCPAASEELMLGGSRSPGRSTWVGPAGHEIHQVSPHVEHCLPAYDVGPDRERRDTGNRETQAPPTKGSW